MELYDAEEAVGIRKILAHKIRMTKNPQTKRTLSWFVRIFMELCQSKVQLAPPHGNFFRGVPNSELVYILLRFQILCIDWFSFFFLKEKPLTLAENLLNFNKTYLGRKQPFETFLKNWWVE